ncbi:hypothetical protein BaRGS_00039336, partial [Batillaria attramentaria]
RTQLSWQADTSTVPPAPSSSSSKLFRPPWLRLKQQQRQTLPHRRCYHCCDDHDDPDEPSVGLCVGVVARVCRADLDAERASCRQDRKTETRKEFESISRPVLKIMFWGLMEVGNLEDSIEELRLLLLDVLDKNDELERELAYVRDTLDNTRPSYSFYARLSENKEIRFEPDEVKVTENVKDSEKNKDIETSTNAKTGIFTAPVTGQYMFTINIVPIGRDNRSFRLHLMLDSTTVLYAKKHENEYHATLWLLQGQRVWLE